MDYEKAYKAVLETAKQWIKDGCTDKEKICLGCVFPELRESEDEKILSNDIDKLNLLTEILNYYKKNLAGLYITFSMYKRIARYFYFLGKKQK